MEVFDSVSRQGWKIYDRQLPRYNKWQHLLPVSAVVGASCSRVREQSSFILRLVGAGNAMPL